LINNGKILKFIDKNSPILEGFVLGRIKKEKWINNGIVSTRIDKDSSLPEGFVFGRIKKAKA
jgi:hypothetical protein